MDRGQVMRELAATSDLACAEILLNDLAHARGTGTDQHLDAGIMMFGKTGMGLVNTEAITDA